MKKIVVAGTKNDSILFSLIGAKTFELKKNEDINNVFDYLESNYENTAGLLIAAKFFDTNSRYFAKLQKMGIPIIMLPDPEGKNIDTTLETLQEKTIGMKIKAN